MGIHTFLRDSTSLSIIGSEPDESSAYCHIYIGRYVPTLSRLLSVGSEMDILNSKYTVVLYSIQFNLFAFVRSRRG